MIESIKIKVKGEWYVSRPCPGSNQCGTCDLRDVCVGDHADDVSDVCDVTGISTHFKKEDGDGAEKA